VLKKTGLSTSKKVACFVHLLLISFDKIRAKKLCKIKNFSTGKKNENDNFFFKKI